MATPLLSEPDDHQLSYINASVQEADYLRSRLVELDKGWRESYFGFQTQSMAEIEHLRSELRLLLAKYVEQEKNYRQGLHSDRAAFAVGMVVGVVITTAIALLLTRC